MYLILLCIWIILNGNFTWEILAFGLVISAALYYFICRFMDYSVQKDLKILRQGFGILRYTFVLVKEIIKANLAVIKMILSGREEVEPTLVSFRTNLKTRTARAFMANAITLTPGTITVSLEDDEYMVHCLDRELAYGMDDTIFTHLLTDLEQPEQKKQRKQGGK